MSKECYFCRKSLPVQKRATVFCGPRCQELYRKVEADAEAKGAPLRDTTHPIPRVNIIAPMEREEGK